MVVGRWSGRKTESKRERAAPREWPTSVTDFVPCAESVVSTAVRMSFAVLCLIDEQTKFNFRNTKDVITHSACSSAKPLCTSTDDGTPGKSVESSVVFAISASVRSAILKEQQH